MTLATPPAPGPGAPPGGIALALQAVGAGFDRPLLVTAPRDETEFLWVVEKGGRILVVDIASNQVINTFLDVSGLVADGPNDERGLLGMAFDPGYRNNRRFYISYINQNGNGDLVVARYLVDAANSTEAEPNENTRILTIPNPRENLFGGMIAFGPDNMLYVSRGHGGDGGGAVGDPDNLSQNIGSLMGKLLRVDVSGGGAGYAIPAGNPCVGQGRGEIWSMGLRNPWRFSFDRANGNLYIGDVGHGSPGEINVSPVASGAGRGQNFGWRIMEGKSCFNPAAGCNTANITQPVLDYTRAGGACSVTGGYVYRGTNPALAALVGTYFYGDFCAGFVRSFRFNGQVTQHAQWPSLSGAGAITSFGEDGVAGNLYITTFDGGVFRIIAQ
jgi:glucose/arabinose dehydrogenase